MLRNLVLFFKPSCIWTLTYSCMEIEYLNEILHNGMISWASSNNFTWLWTFSYAQIKHSSSFWVAPEPCLMCWYKANTTPLLIVWTGSYFLLLSRELPVTSFSHLCVKEARPVVDSSGPWAKALLIWNPWARWVLVAGSWTLNTVLITRKKVPAGGWYPMRSLEDQLSAMRISRSSPNTLSSYYKWPLGFFLEMISQSWGSLGS